LLQRLGGDVQCAITLIELLGLGGRDLIEAPYETLLQFNA
jgi:adenine/guanine phosphoribosyltransferase-like PRPP-binding protein